MRAGSYEQAVIFCEPLEKAAAPNLSRDKTSHQRSITKILYDKNLRSLEDSEFLIAFHLFDEEGYLV